MRPRIDGMALAGIALLALFGFYIIRGWTGGDKTNAVAVTADVSAVSEEAAPTSSQPDVGAGGQENGATVADSAAFALPYSEYILTQGPHGQSYGHYAIDLAAGKGEVIHSPINGVVTQRYIDQWNNTVIIIENDTYVVTMFHGDYTANMGETVTIGQPVGTESNHGYTMDMYGNLCAGRDCGYHTHLNVFDRRVGYNVNPLDLVN
ncbi:MAG: M23 family metallopeptidase [Chloroflexota bacterium]